MSHAYSAVEAGMADHAAVSAAAPLRVAQVVRSLNTGGQEMLCARVAERLAADGAASSVLALQGGGFLEQRLRAAGVPVHCLGAKDGLRLDLVFRIAALLRRDRIRIVHCHNRQAFFYAGLASLLVPGTRLVLTKHGAHPWNDADSSAVIRFLLKRTRAVIAVSADAAEVLRRGDWVTDHQLHTVLNGVDTDEFGGGDRTAARTALGLAPEHAVIGTVARLSPEKDQATLLRAFARVAETLPQARLAVVGDGSMRAELERLAAELGIADRTLFPGERKDVAALLPAFDVFCLPSLTEGTPLTLLEAMACRVPVVATAVGGVPEVVRDERSGLLVPPGEPEALARALHRALTEPELSARLAEAGRETVEARYSMRGMMRRYHEIYRAALA